MSEIQVNTTRAVNGDIQMTMRFSDSSITMKFAEIAIERAVAKLADEIVKTYKDQILTEVDFTQLAHLVLAKSAERIADRISKAI